VSGRVHRGAGGLDRNARQSEYDAGRRDCTIDRAHLGPRRLAPRRWPRGSRRRPSLVRRRRRGAPRRSVGFNARRDVPCRSRTAWRLRPGGARRRPASIVTPTESSGPPTAAPSTPARCSSAPASLIGSSRARRALAARCSDAPAALLATSADRQRPSADMQLESADMQRSPADLHSPPASRRRRPACLHATPANRPPERRGASAHTTAILRHLP